MSYQEKLDAALVILDEYNAAIGQDNPGYVKADEFVSNLKVLGAVTEEDLNGLKWENILQCINAARVPAYLQPQKLAEKIAKAWRPEKVEESTKVAVTAKKAEKMTLRQLVENLDPEEPESPVAKRLNGWAKGNPFIVYSAGRAVNVEETFQQISALKAGHPPVSMALVEGIPVKVWRLGELPEHTAKENPLYPNRPLRPDETCDQTLRSWAGVSQEVRQFLRLALTQGGRNGGFDIMSIKDANDHIDEALGNDLNAIRRRYPHISILFEERKKKGTLPTLEVDLASPKNLNKGYKEAAPNHPFLEEGKKVVWMYNQVQSTYTAVDPNTIQYQVHWRK